MKSRNHNNLVGLGFATALLAMPVQAAVSFDFATIGNPNNPAAPTPGGNTASPGSIAEEFRMSKHEVTVGQYTEFLNAVAAEDTHSLYNPAMTSSFIAGIERTGSTGSYTYSVIGSTDVPVTYVTWFDAARFINWLHNGQPSGSQASGITEDGVYTLTGTNQGSDTRSVNAAYFFPTESEWVKAAYYDPTPGASVDNYWNYATTSDTAPYSDQAPGSDAPDITNVANYSNNDGIANGYNDGFATIGSPTFDGSVLLTDVGSYTQSTSYYGLFDMEGNVAEWTEGWFGSFDFAIVRGGGYFSSVSQLGRTTWGSADTEGSNFQTGFRVAAPGVIPEPASVAVLGLGGIALMASRRDRSLINK